MKQVLKLVLPVLLIVLIVLTADAQCAMCKVSAQESSFASKLNTGILYLLFAPVVILGSVLLLWIKNKDKFSANADNTHA